MSRKTRGGGAREQSVQVQTRYWKRDGGTMGMKGEWGEQEGNKGGSRREEWTQRTEKEREEKMESCYTFSCIPHSPCVSFIATVFLACWHAAALGDCVWMCVSTSTMSCLCVCLKCLCLICSLMGTVFAHCLTAAREPSSTLLLSFFFFFYLSSPLLPSSAPPPTTASIHSSLIALATDCVEDSSTDFTDQIYEHVIAATCLWGDVWISLETFLWCWDQGLCTCTHPHLCELRSVCLYGGKLVIIWASQRCKKHKHAQIHTHTRSFVQ